MRFAGNIAPGNGSGDATGQTGPSAAGADAAALALVVFDAVLVAGFFAALALSCADALDIWPARPRTVIIITPVKRRAPRCNVMCMTRCIISTLLPRIHALAAELRPVARAA